jgi:hypothetical protein
LALLLGLSFLGACVSGGADGGENNGPECYSNTECGGGSECSGGICVGFVGCAGGTACRNNELCMDGICRLECEQASDCSDLGLTCGTTDTLHCKPMPNPSRPQTQPKSGTGGTTSTGAGGSGSSSAAGGPAAAGSPAAGAPAAGTGGV